ncbi:RNA polymerase sigma factor [Streptomyces sp. TLI_105]|uniref:RNA polymerase sigma factor n=1 Tax=Streptomyces sp. TLI_105 TaxID=1881019 RepID=UPI0008967BAF|nr:RNA polymerase sigma factor [Streptomyces sp. TLI_105]SED81496.1 RNA polymerase sigma-70 factor, ECF subfamily [Streptomyces sp. TLI_105]
MRDRFRAGDPTALGEAYDEHARVLYHYAYRVCGDRAAAEDVVSAAFLEAWRCRGKVHADGGSLRPWLLGIATNIMRGAAREARRRDAALARIPERGVLPDFADDVLARMTDGEQIRAARAALGRLRRREREVFTLVVWAGLDYAAAGEALGIPVGTVRSRLSRARERLRKLAEAELRAARRRERSAAAAVRSAGRPAPGGAPAGAGGSLPAAEGARGSVTEEARGSVAVLGAPRVSGFPAVSGSPAVPLPSPSAMPGALTVPVSVPGPVPDPSAVPALSPGTVPPPLAVPAPPSDPLAVPGSRSIHSTVRPALAPRPTSENQA